MIKKIMSVILTVVMSLSLCTVAFAVDVSENNYEIFMLPVISDKLPTENQVTEIKVYLDKQTDTAFVALEDVCELIGASCSQEDDIYAVQRDAVYFSYNGQGNMELYLLTENSTSVFLDAVAQATGSIIRKNIIGHRLLDGDLFESRKISNQWYVDYIKFCDMFGVKLSKYTSNNHNNLLAIMQELNISLSHDVKFNFDKNPYYVKMYSGTTLSSIYQKVMRNYETYLFDYYALKTKNSDFWDDVTQKLGTMFQLADLQYKNVLSNVINDWNGFTSALIDQYEPGEHYTESLVNILNSNYLEYVIKNSNPNNELLTFSDFVEYVSSFYYYIWDKAPTWTANALSAHENTENYIEFFNTLTETNNDYKKVLESMSGIDDSASGFSIAKIILNSMIAFKEVHNTCNQINNLSSDKMNFLQKGIFENEKLVAESSKINISGVIDKISQTANILYPAGVLNMSSNYVRKALQNSDNNAKGVIDSAKKIYDTYGNVGEQNLEKLKEVLKTAIYTELDEGTQQVLSKFPETVPIAVAMSVIDGSMALAKSAIGEELKDAENLVQYYYIEQNLLCNLNEWNPEKLHINLTFALMASLCCYENQKKVMESVFQELESQEIDLPKYYFESMEEKRKELDDSINKIAEALYQLDHQKTQLCIDYYHDPRNNNVSAEIVEAILHYNNGTIAGRVITDNNQPIEKAKISVFVFANGIGIGSKEDVYYTDSDGKFSIPVSARNEYMLQVTCDGYKSADDNEFVKIYPIVVQKQKTNRVSDIHLKKKKTEVSIPSDAFNYNGHSYYIYSGVAKTWEEAKAYCESLGGYLAVINDELENAALYNYMTRYGYSSAYFGYSDSENEGIWKWVSNDTSNYANWAPGEPNQERNTEDYAMFYFKYTDGKWNDGDFNGNTVQDTSAFICEWNSLGKTNDNYKEHFIKALLDNEDDWFEYYGMNGFPSIIEFNDLDFDGLPELIMQMGGGTMLNCDAYAYSFHNDTLVKSEMFQNRLNIYRDTNSGKYKVIGHQTWRDGLYKCEEDTFDFSYDGNHISTNYFLVNVTKNEDEQSTEKYYSAEGSWYGHHNTKNTNKIVSELTENEYNQILIGKSEGLEPVYLKSYSINAADYKDYSDDKKREVLEKAFDSFGYCGYSDQIQYYNGKHYYTTDHIVGEAHVKYDFSKAKSSYIALPSLNGSVDGSDLGVMKLSFDNFAIIRDKIYFTCEYPKDGPNTIANLYVCNMDGSDIKLIYKYVHYNFAYDENKIYFQTVNVNSEQLENKKSYDINSGKIIDFPHTIYLSFSSKFSPFRSYESNYYYDGGMYYQNAIPNDDEEIHKNEHANMFIHRVDKNGRDVIVGKWWFQAR